MSEKVAMFLHGEAIDHVATHISTKEGKVECEALVATVGCSKLSLGLAVAYIRQSRKTIAAYAGQYKKFVESLACTKTIEFAKCANDDEKTIHKTILFNVYSVKDFLSGKAGLLMFYCAYLSPESIPLELFQHEELLGSKSKVISATKLLATYGLVTQSADKSVIFMEPNVQRAIRDYLFVFHNNEELIEEESDSVLDLYDDVLRPLSNALTLMTPESFLIPNDFKEAYLLCPLMKAFGLNLWKQSIAIQNGTKELFTDLAENILDTCFVSMIHSSMFMSAGEVGDTLLEIQGPKYGIDNKEVARTLANLGIIAYHRGDAMKAVAIFENVLITEEKHYGKDHVEVANTLDHYASALNDLKSFSKAKNLGMRAIGIKEKALGSNSVSTAKSKGKLASTLNGLGNFTEAKDLFQKALQIKENHFGMDSIENVEIMENLAFTLKSLGEIRPAQDLLNRALSVKEKCYEAKHPEIALTLGNLANITQELNAEKAKELYEQALTMNKTNYGKNSIQVARTLGDMAGVLKKLGELKEAEKMYQTSLELKEKWLGSHHLEIASTMNNLSIVEKDLGGMKYARVLLEKAKKICEKCPETSQAVLAKVMENLKQYEVK